MMTERPDAPLLGFETGVVIDVDDPEKVGRVRVQIPGLFNDGTGWALPFSFGGGGKQLGSFFVPPLGSEVAVFFKRGDPDQPYYFGGNLGRGEQLTGTDGDPKVRAIETESYVIAIDERDGSRSLTLLDKQSQDVIQMNGEARAISIKALAAVSIEAQGIVTIKGLEVIINNIPAGLGRL